MFSYKSTHLHARARELLPYVPLAHRLARERRALALRPRVSEV